MREIIETTTGKKIIITESQSNDLVDLELIFFDGTSKWQFSDCEAIREYLGVEYFEEV